MTSSVYTPNSSFQGFQIFRTEFGLRLHIRKATFNLLVHVEMWQRIYIFQDGDAEHHVRADAAS